MVKEGNNNDERKSRREKRHKLEIETKRKPKQFWHVCKQKHFYLLIYDYKFVWQYRAQCIRNVCASLHRYTYKIKCSKPCVHKQTHTWIRNVEGRARAHVGAPKLFYYSIQFQRENQLLSMMVTKYNLCCVHLWHTKHIILFSFLFFFLVVESVCPFASWLAGILSICDK